MGRKNAIARLKEYARRSGSELKFVVVSMGQDDKRVVMRVVINGCSFPDGVGENAKEAKENAARIAQRNLDDKENQNPAMKKKDPNVQPYRKNLRTRLFDHLPECKPTGVSCTVVTEDGASAGPPTPQTVLDSCGASSVPVAKACNSSKNPKVTQCPEEKDSLNTPSVITSAISEIVSHSGFDCVTLIGEGAFGRVYKARDKLVGKYYAIKVIPCKEKALREAKALSVLDHLNIVRYHTCWMGDSGCQSDSADSSCSSQSSSGSSAMFLYIQLELCDTKTLRDWIDERNMEKSSPNSKRREESLNIAQQMVRGVEYIHSNELIHRDLKPSNILFGQDGKVKIGDFGLVTADNADDDKTPMERTLDKGTPPYMAPEQESGKTYDRKVDIFALGLIYFELLWTIPTYHERDKIWGDVRRQKLPREFAHSFTPEYIIIKLMLSVKPEERPEACKAVTELDECAHKLNIEEIVRRGRTTV